LNVARLANVPKAVLDVASVKSKELENSVERRKIENMYRLVGKLMDPSAASTAEDALDRVINGIEQL
jgi:DNA mismatch repair protein MSH3